MTDNSFNHLKLIPFDRYLVRPKMLGGESLRGFVYRFYNANGVKAPREIWPLINNLSKTEMATWSTKEELQYLIGTYSNLSEFDFFNQYLLLKKRNDLRSNYLAQYRFCPTCVNEKSIHYALWDLPMFTACPIHGCRLVYFCEQCKLPFYWSTLNVDWQCQCKFNLKESSSQPASESEIYISKVILNAIDIPKASLYLEYMDEKNSNKYTLSQWFDTLKWASKFREILKLLGNHKLAKLTQHSISLGELDSTDFKFLLKSPSLKHIRKLLKRLSNKNKQFVCHIRGFNNLNVICTECKCVTEHDHPFIRHLTPIFKISINEYLIQLQHELTGYLNTPNVTISKPFSLHKFYEWWKQVMHLTAKFTDVPKNNELKILYFRGGIYDAIEAIFRRLIRASQLNGSALIYANIFRSWDLPETLKTPYGFENILSNLDNYLRNLDVYELLVLNDLVELADQSIKENSVV